MADDWRGSKSKIYIKLPRFNVVYIVWKQSASNVYKRRDFLSFSLNIFWCKPLDFCGGGGRYVYGMDSGSTHKSSRLVKSLFVN